MESITPQEAVDQYLQSRHDVTRSTKENHRYRLNYFIQWTEEQAIEEMNELTGMDCERFKNWRIENFDLNLVTLQYHIGTLRVFLRWCESVNAANAGIADNILIPKVSDSEKARDVHLTHERSQQIVDYLAKYEWASNAHVIFSLLYHTGMRRSSLNALDVEDWCKEEQYLKVRHRPEKGTSLKLKEEGERNISITNNRLIEALCDYIKNQRHDASDEYGRNPLITSAQGRLHYQTISKICYKVTRPCYFTDGCPLDRDIDTCDGTSYQGYSKCPESVSSHPIRRSAITHHLDSDVPKAIVSERMNASENVLDHHYDARNKEQKRKNRQKYLNKI